MRLRLANSLGNRDETTTKDERVLNGFVESQGGRRATDRTYVVKRPGMTSRYTLATGVGGATQGQGLFCFSTPPGTTTLIGIRGDKLTDPVV